MPPPIARTPLPSSEPPRWVRAIDALCLALVVLSALVAMSGGFRVRIGPLRVAVTSPYATLLWAFAIAIVRHVLAPGAPIYRDLPARLAAWWREPGVHTAAIATAGTRPAILFVGYMAVLVFGYPPGPAPPVQINNELVNLQARWDANWYLGIVTEGYHFVPNQPGLQQSVAFFPAYPLLVRGVGRILGGRLTSYIGAGVLVSFASFFLALIYLYALARDTLGEDEARFAVWAMATYPFALFFGAIYTEPLLLLGMTATFYHFTHGRYVRAAAWGVLVGLTKTNGFLVSIPLAMLALQAGQGVEGRQGGQGGRGRQVVTAMLAAAGPGVGMLIYSAFVWHLTGDPLGWLRAHGAWGREYSGLLTLVGDRVNIIANAGVEGYVASLPHDLINALGVIFVLVAVWPVTRKLGLAYAVFILIYMLPPMAAGGLISAGRFSSVLFPAFLWLAGAVPPRHRPAWLASFAAFQALNAAMFYTWRPLYQGTGQRAEGTGAADIIRGKMPRILSRRLYLPALLLAVGVPLCAVLVVAQGQRRAQAPAAPATPFQAAMRAFIEGRYAEVDTLTAKLDLKDPNVVALRGRAAIERGLYADAESALQAAASRAPASEAALELGLLQQMLSRPAARTTLSRVAALAETSQNARELARAGRALHALDLIPDAKMAFIAATRLAPNDAEIEAAFGDLFLAKYNNAEAVKSYQRVLELDPRWAPALIGAAHALEDENPPQAAALVKRAMEINPNSVDAHIFLANQAIDSEKRAEARELLTKALAINPSSLDARGTLAALAYVEDKTQEFEAEVAKVLAISPTHGEVYRTAGELVAHNYRFEEAVTLTRKALALTPNDPRALADLGAQLLRTGDEPEARSALEASFKIDPYDVVTFNALSLLDSLDKFETIRDGDLIVKLSREEAPVLKEYTVALAHEALKTMAAKYEFQPKGPILIEMFPKHDDFAVRTLGLPGMIGALGACFGRVVTLDSPKARPPGDFQWEATLWHELGHVITLQMSNQRVPRWLTEGISEYEERRAHREWARQMDFTFASLLNRDETIKLKDLNAAFQDPKLIGIAYYQASLVVDHIVATFGQSGLNKLVRAYATGVDTETALKDVLHTDFDTLQIGFDSYTERTFGTLQKALVVPKDVQLAKASPEELRKLANENPRSYPVQLTYGHALRKAGSTDEAMQVFERAAALAPSATGDDSPRAQMAEIALEKKDRTRAIAELTAFLNADFENVGAAHKLASLLKEAGVTDPARLRPVYERIVALDPFDGDARAALGRMAMQRNDVEYAAREFRTVIALKPIDPAVAHTDLAESYLKAGKRDEAKRQTLAALEIAPTYERAQDLLLKLAEARP